MAAPNDSTNAPFNVRSSGTTPTVSTLPPSRSGDSADPNWALSCISALPSKKAMRAGETDNDRGQIGFFSMTKCSKVLLIFRRGARLSGIASALCPASRRWRRYKWAMGANVVRPKPEMSSSAIVFGKKRSVEVSKTTDEVGEELAEGAMPDEEEITPWLETFNETRFGSEAKDATEVIRLKEMSKRVMLGGTDNVDDNGEDTEAEAPPRVCRVYNEELPIAVDEEDADSVSDVSLLYPT